MRYLLLLSLLFVVPSADCAYSQDCPGVVVSCPDSDLGPTLTFSANVSGSSPSAKLTFNWIVSAGKIISGQGTASIIVDTTEAGGQSFTGTVEVVGIPKECGNKASCSIIVCPGLPVARKFDEYGDLPSTEERAPRKALHSRTSKHQRAMHRSHKRRIPKQTS
ncbi:MAG: hypothetical protein QOH71_1217 [Blastocatellia bacterium]|jgi:hypothetical protein|nr:hypothetical protein [Blastocatellia bacterium]